MAKASILISYLVTQSSIRTFFVKNISKSLAFWQARFDRLWDACAFDVIGNQREMAEDL